ncbi:precorrin-3B synthase [Spirilliplanes yamanashiensis]|uniref:Precorrin-3B synthase n=1 Tax=Spirilliplanes yamanashiensis TaxID=42233 RepID=A0A8J3Y7G0_9ACTN|nr:precorrin-3B synthase [Spirilliplanes yamanashiensis]MDP9817520.1 precorrin-3B synthase [Spirilliplanes yamanashiensis]GIJ02827.1 precorrin-3B synthase [Spirilliplanes yamanashiensis]
MPTPPPGRRPGPDACPGALRLHAAADGPLARVRVPGGVVTAAQLRAVGALARAHGDGHAELTSRANLQLRALRAEPVTLAAALRAAGLLPSDTHETVRNILASPLAATRLPVARLDAGLCADARLADLPGRFLFALDDGALDVAARADVAAVPAGGATAILLAGADAGVRVADPVAGLLAAAHAFLDERAAQGGTAWRLAELTDGPARVAARLGGALDGPRLAVRPGSPVAPGLLPGPAGPAVSALVPLGRLHADQLDALAAAGDPVVVTPWRGVVVPGLADPAPLAAAGLETSPGSRWAGVSACAGRPGCAKSHADVRAAADAATRPGGGRPVHWTGCPRGCGAPAGDHVRVEATATGWTVDGRPAATGDLAAAVAAAR